MKRHTIVFILLVVLSSCSIIAAPVATKQPTLADYSIGEKWVWKFKGVTSEGVTRANGTDIKEVIDINNELYVEGNPGAVPLDEIVKPEESPTPRYSWPLRVGKKWKFEQSWTSQDGTTGKSSFDAEVLSFREEQVDAGVFMAYTIKFKGKITNSRGHSTDTEEIIWYSPATKNFIKLTQIQEGYLYEEELIEYSKP